MEKILPSKSGLATARRGNLFLHSAYDPEKEARRFAKSRFFSRPPGLILILGEVLGYLGPALQEEFPGARIISVFCSSSLFAHRTQAFTEGAIPFWHPRGGESLRTFLSYQVRDQELGGLQILEWEPAFQAYPELMDTLLAEAAQFSREALGSALTSAYFGRRWIKNSLRNYLSLEEAQVLEDSSAPVLIAASGPGLEEALPLLQLYRQRFSLWALPSALDFLLYRGLEPDLIVLSDPGFYTGYHFHSLRRKNFPAGRGPGILHPLTAHPLPREFPQKRVIFQQGNPIEIRLLQGLEPESFYYPSHGTVAGSAIQIALSRSAGPVFIAGLDLAVRDWIEHVRPNSFDTLLETTGEKFEPLESKKYRRMLDFYPEKLEGPYRSSSPLKTYAGWFSSRPFPHLYRLAPSPVNIGLPQAPSKIWKTLPRRSPQLGFRPLVLPGQNERKDNVRRILEELRREIQGALSGAKISPFARDMVEMIDPQSLGGTPGPEVLPFLASLSPLTEDPP